MMDGVEASEAAAASSTRAPPADGREGEQETPPQGFQRGRHRRRRQPQPRGSDHDQSDHATPNKSSSSSINIQGGGFFLGGGSPGRDDDGDPDANVGGDTGSDTVSGSGGDRRSLAVDARQDGDVGIDGGGARGAGAGADDSLISSPRKKQRLRNLRLAKGMERAREKDIGIVGCWIPSVP